MNFHGGYFGDKPLIDFSVNIPPLAYQTSFTQFLSDSIEGLVKYPQIKAENAIKQIADSLGYEANRIILGNGATELIYLYARAFKSSKVMIMDPTFTEYRRAFDMYGVETYSYPMDLDHLDHLNAQSVIDLMGEHDCDTLVFCNPNNPTGHVFDLEWISQLVRLKPNLKLFIDESFIDFVPLDYQEAYNQLMAQVQDQVDVFRLRSMTKTYAVPGIRLGYAIGSVDTIRQLLPVKEPWTINHFAIKATDYFIKHPEWVQKIYEWTREENAYLYDALTQLGTFKVFKGQANYLLIQISQEDVLTFNAHLQEKGFFLRTCTDFLGLDDTYYRIALRQHADNSLLVQAIKEVYNEK